MSTLQRTTVAISVAYDHKAMALLWLAALMAVACSKGQPSQRVGSPSGKLCVTDSASSTLLGRAV